MRIMLDDGAFLPTRGHDADAGMDLRCKNGDGKIVPAYGSAVFDTGVHVLLEEGTVGFLKSKSGLNVYHGITSEGVIDAGYTGSIMVKLYNHSDMDYMVNSGDKITQLVILPCLLPQVEIVDELPDTDRGENGFGSTGR